MHAMTGTKFSPLITLTGLTSLEHLRTNFTVVAHNFPEEIEVDGVLGLDFFRGLVLTLDFARGRFPSHRRNGGGTSGVSPSRPSSRLPGCRSAVRR